MESFTSSVIAPPFATFKEVSLENDVVVVNDKPTKATAMVQRASGSSLIAGFLLRHFAAKPRPKIFPKIRTLTIPTLCSQKSP